MEVHKSHSFYVCLLLPIFDFVRWYTAKRCVQYGVGISEGLLLFTLVSLSKLVLLRTNGLRYVNFVQFSGLCDLLLFRSGLFTFSKPTCYVMHQQFNTQQLYALPTMYLYVLYLSENKQRLVPLTAQNIGFYNRDEKCFQQFKVVCASSLNG